jgi:hypothetical protein
MHDEITGFRDPIYSLWHRLRYINRFIGRERAQLLTMVDLDASLWIEWDDGVKEPVALIETAKDSKDGKEKRYYIIQGLARRVVPTIPAWVVLYQPSRTNWLIPYKIRDIELFRVKRVWPNPQARDKWTIFTPKEYAEMLVRVRKRSEDLRSESSSTNNADLFRPFVQPELWGDWMTTIQDGAATATRISIS